MKSKIYKVKVKYIFEGEFFVEADSKMEAKDIVSKDCGLVIGGDIHTSSPAVKDWEFSIHPDSHITSINVGRVVKDE